MRICELREEKLGNVCDIEFEERTGKIIALIIPGPCKILGIIGRDQEYIIPYECVQRIGADVVLVEVERDKCLKKCKWDN